MKITLKTIRLITIATVIYTLLLALSCFIKVRHTRLSPIEYYSLIFTLEALYLLLLVYLINVLTALKEKTSITTAFIMYACLEVIQIIGNLLPTAALSIYYATWIGVLNLVLTIYLLLQTFKIKNSTIALPFKIFGSSLLYLLLVKIIVTLAFPRAANRETMHYLDFISLFTPIAALFILKRLAELIKSNDNQSSTILPG